MAQELRKVKFTLDNPIGFNPNVNAQGRQEWKDGFFHLFTHIEELSPQSQRFREKCVALVEDLETGRVHYVDIECFKFTSMLQ